MRRVLPLLCSLIVCISLSAQKDCPTTEYSEHILSAHPDMIKKLNAVENFISSHSGDRRTVMSGTTTGFSLPDVIVIPVVVHILYNSDAQNISDKQVFSQIESLNNDFRKLNTDRYNIPSYFSGIAADCGIEFRLAKTDPKGVPTTGIVRRKTSIQYFGTDDRAKYTSRGGDDTWDATRYLNIWVCNLSGGVIGYSSLVECPADQDGVVIHTGVFGVNTGNTSYNKGRTATHEIGHWLNLRHIWGDTYCGDDKVDDTPPQRSPNRGCPSGKNFTCGASANGDMYMNFMDLTNDACMYMFTQGQRERMRAIFMPGGPRNSLLHSNVLTSAKLEEAPLPADNIGTQIYPNPAISSITLQLVETELSTEKVYIIYNHIGQPVHRFTSKSNKTTVLIGHLANGMYYIKSNEAGSKTIAKFVKIS